MLKIICYFAIIQLFITANDAIGQSTSSSERVYLHTDRDIYVAGEDLFFKCYRFDAMQKSLIGSKFAYLILRNDKNSLITGICLKLENDMYSGSIYLPDTLSTGVYQLVSFTNCMRNAGEEIFFTKEILIANRFDQSLTRIYPTLGFFDTIHKVNSDIFPDSGTHLISIKSEKTSYLKREKILVALDALGIKANEIAQLSISVHEKVQNSASKFRLRSTYPHLQKANPETSRKDKSTDNNSCLHLPEVNGIIIEGHVISTENQKTIANATIYLSTPDTIANLQFTHTNHDGIFRFLLNDYYNNKNLILSLPKIEKGRIELVDKYDLTLPFNPSKQFPDSLIKRYLIKSQSIVQVQKIYKIEYKQEITKAMSMKGVAPMVYPPVSNPVYPSDFVNLPDFVEISRELIPLLKTRKHGDKYEARIIDLDNSKYFNNDPLIFLDGVPINNINQIIGLGTEKIKKIETVGFERFDGNSYFEGILAVFSNKMEINNIVWETPTLVNKYIAFHPLSVMQVPNLLKTNEAPDFRQLLYWEPSVTLKSNEKKILEFSASGNKGEFEITVEGFTSEGNFINTNAIFKIDSK